MDQVAARALMDIYTNAAGVAIGIESTGRGVRRVHAWAPLAGPDELDLQAMGYPEFEPMGKAGMFGKDADLASWYAFNVGDKTRYTSQGPWKTIEGEE